MKDKMIVLVFRVPKNTVNLNIGEHVELEYDSVKEHYCLNTEFARVSNQLFTPNSDDVKSLLEFVSLEWQKKMEELLTSGITNVISI